jgi:hypothetical protein
MAHVFVLPQAEVGSKVNPIQVTNFGSSYKLWFKLQTLVLAQLTPRREVGA